jgi:streptogramin lyase
MSRRSTLGKLAASGLLAIWALLAAATSAADGATPTIYPLTEATHASSIAPAPDGTVWFVPSRGTRWEGGSESIIGSITSDGTVVEHEVSGFGPIQRVAVGPQGELWILGESGGYRDEVFELGRVSTTGELERRYVIGHGHGPYRSAVGELTVTTYGVWFVRERSGGSASIERLDPATGAIRRFSPTPGYRAYGLAGTRDGSVWFTEGDSGRIDVGRIRPGATVQLWRVEGRATVPVSIAAGREGTVWFGLANGRVGRITPTRSLALFKVPDSFLYSIAVGTEGRLWFQSSFGGWNARALNSIGIGGRLGQPICADPTCQLNPRGLAWTPDGSLWYGLERPNLNTGGGGSGLGIEEEINNEAGSVARLVP